MSAEFRTSLMITTRQQVRRDALHNFFFSFWEETPYISSFLSSALSNILGRAQILILAMQIQPPGLGLPIDLMGRRPAAQ